MGQERTLAFDIATAEEIRCVTDPVIRLESVSVRFRIPAEPIRSFKEYMIRRIRRQLGFWEVWALRDVSLEVQRGEVLGIIGRNGSGKSTLLKVIARVLRPTSGRVWVKGRVAPLLELGGGFHPELTGRENIFLNGTLLGHTRQEIAERLDWIVDFAELWDFIDAPLRTYSTGMVARLGFAVATAWEPEILLIDEVLAVGDTAFQRKCIARLQEFRQRGTTVLLVSHNSQQIRQLCDYAIWLDSGSVQAFGSPETVTAFYEKVMQ
ncbi:ABC transporter ATP-binding protein [Thermoflexus sp.]|uniref:ABC transporter ATP-binding protein n=1 Tax=Thermoflexus sp. TaxID=1969742 RepID=UPI002ADE3788|nr:ABC transporter ATP-binding protein [Thermoflexus sp.]